jgi:5-methylcytosine-specific restriction endonuclease McrA
MVRHVLYSRGGTTEVCNLVVSCPSCNYAKGTMGDATFRRRLPQYVMGWRDRLAKRGTPPPGDRSFR